MGEKIEQVREFVPRYQVKKDVESSLSQKQRQGVLNSNYLIAKLSQNIDEFKKVKNTENGEFRTLGEEFEVRWYHILEKYGMEYLPPNIPLHMGSKSLLFRDLISLIEEMMSRSGARKDKQNKPEVSIGWISE